ncbi:MAG: AraC family transcriptional regulator [Micropepsaceae bacterium]
MLKWVRSGVLAGAQDLVSELGGDFEELAKQASIPTEALSNPDTPIPAGSVVQFLEGTSSALACEAFGLRLGQLQDLTLFGPLWSLFQSAATVGELLHDLADYFPLHTQGTLFAIEPSSDGVLVTYDVAADIARPRRQVVELGFSVLIGELRRHNSRWKPQEVFLRHAPPRDTRWHQRLFGPGLIFNADRNAAFIDRAFLTTPTRSGNRLQHGELATGFDEASENLAGVVYTRTEIVVRALLPFSPCNLATTARIMRISTRTLQRRLASDGTSFDEIVDAVRADLALSYITDSHLTVAEVAEVLQFSETSALSRAFRRWHGLSPRHLR